MIGSIAHVNVGATGASQDRCAVLSIGSITLVALADGAGNSTAGAEVASAVIETLLHEAVHGLDLRDERLLVDVLRSLDQRFAKSKTGGESTAVVAALAPGRVVGASIGDSGACLVPADGHTIDLTKEQLRKPLLGSGRAVPVPFVCGTSPSMTLVVASDGLFGYVDEARAREIVQSSASVEVAVHNLLAATRLPTGALRDDVSIVAVRTNLRR
ncbi:MAG: SpoIIE family protein phosphatase [Polyangiaceae bacterium]